MRMPARSVTKAKAPTFAAVVNRPMGALDHNLNRRAGKAQPKRVFCLALATASRYSVTVRTLGSFDWSEPRSTAHHGDLYNCGRGCALRRSGELRRLACGAERDRPARGR